MLALAGGLATMGCGGGSDRGEGAAPASQEQREAATGDRGGRDGEPGRGEESEDRTGQDGEPAESGSSQSTSTSQGGSVSQSITQSSNGGSSSSSSSSSSVNGVKTFSGTGRTDLTFNVEQPSRLVWTHTEGRRFSASGGGISIDSRAGRGEVALEAGRYEDVRVSGASWTIVVRPR